MVLPKQFPAIRSLMSLFWGVRSETERQIANIMNIKITEKLW